MELKILREKTYILKIMVGPLSKFLCHHNEAFEVLNKVLFKKLHAV
jgi:hypothetical protein